MFLIRDLDLQTMDGGGDDTENNIDMYLLSHHI